MRFFLDAPFKWKMVFVVVVISWLVAAITTTIFSIQKYNVFNNDFESRLKLETKILSASLGPALLFLDQESANETIKSFYQDSAIDLVEVKNANDNVVFRLSRNDLSNDADSKNIILKNNRKFEGNIVIDKNIIGEVAIFANTSELNNAIEVVFIAAGINLIITAVLAVLFSLKLQSLISKPIIDLYRLSKHVAENKDYSIRATAISNDEVGQLSNMFNQMIKKIEQREEKLEKLVEQRTFELEKMADDFRYRAFHDSLTGLPNRALLNERFELAMEYASRNENKFSCLLLDLDNFKTINDTKGHNFGDELLVEVAKRLKDTVRGNDFVCRLGGDEFVIIIVDLDTASCATVVVEKILENLNQDFHVHNEIIKTAVSIGVAMYPDDGDDLNSIKRKADVAMYKAKDTGKNCFYIFSPDMQEDVNYRMMIHNDLPKAIKENELEVYFQPKINIQNQSVDGCEALVRWNHPVKGFLNPSAFIPYAEENNQVISIDYYVVEKVCETLSRWNSFGLSVSIAVNLSGRHFHSFEIVEHFKKLIEKYQLDPKLLEVEITEAVLIYDPEVAQKIVHAIKGLGLRFSLDDFGTGYSSLNYLRTLPIDNIKLDRSFIAQVESNFQDQRVIKEILSLGQGLGLKIIAEGVETQTQLDILRQMGCDYIQGFYYLKPTIEEKFLEWINIFNSDQLECENE